jgi:hypothetical protein
MNELLQLFRDPVHGELKLENFYLERYQIPEGINLLKDVIKLEIDLESQIPQPTELYYWVPTHLELYTENGKKLTHEKVSESV